MKNVVKFFLGAPGSWMMDNMPQAIERTMSQTPRAPRELTEQEQMNRSLRSIKFTLTVIAIILFWSLIW